MASARFEIREVRTSLGRRLLGWVGLAASAVVSDGAPVTGGGRRWDVVDLRSGEVVGTITEAASDRVDVGAMATADLAGLSSDEWSRIWLGSSGR